MTEGVAEVDAVGVRILGALVEKEHTTPDNYPLTLNALVAACNQTSNRDPVLSLDEATVARSVEALSRRNLVRELYRSDSRVKRYRHGLADTMHLHPAEIAVMSVLMLRGGQTVGEIRTRTARVFQFRDLPHVDVTLQSLMTMSTPLVAQLPRRPGQKEVRYAHLLSGEPEDAQTREDAPSSADEAADPDRVGALENAVMDLQKELAELRSMFDQFRTQFE